MVPSPHIATKYYVFVLNVLNVTLQSADKVRFYPVDFREKSALTVLIDIEKNQLRF